MAYVVPSSDSDVDFASSSDAPVGAYRCDSDDIDDDIDDDNDDIHDQHVVPIAVASSIVNGVPSRVALQKVACSIISDPLLG